MMTNSARPLAIRAFTPSPGRLGELQRDVRRDRRGVVQLIRLRVTTPDTDSTIATARVSPSARPRPSIAPPMTPERPYGSTAIRIISQRVAPRASAASRCRDGAWGKTSREIALMIGRIITASTRPAVSIVRPVADAGPAKSGIQPRLRAARSEGHQPGARPAMPQKPKTMLGMAASRSTM